MALQGGMIVGRQIKLLRRVAKSGNYYLITLPREIGEVLHRKLVLVTIEIVEVSRGGVDNG